MCELNREYVYCACGNRYKYQTAVAENMVCPTCESVIPWQDRNMDYVPTAEEMISALKRELVDAAYDLQGAQEFAEFGDIPDAAFELQKELHYQINLLGRDPVEVINELMAEHGFDAVRAVA